MMKKKGIAWLLTACMFTGAFFAGCGEPDSSSPSPVVEQTENDTEVEKPDQRNEGEDGLAYFYRVSAPYLLNREDGQNAIYSPINVYLALGMLAEITDGDSRQQILQVLGEDSLKAVEERAGQLWNDNYIDSEMPEGVCLLANSLWMDNEIELKEDVTKRLEDDYFATSHRGEMGSAELNQELQDWLNENTNDFLKNQVGNMQFSQETIVALASAIYLKANWREQFGEGATKEEVFHGSHGEEIVPFMNQEKTNIYYYGEHFGAVAKYMNGVGYMLFVLPAEGVSIQELLEDEEYRRFMEEDRAEWEQHKNALIHMSIPKFDITGDLDLIPIMQQLGITDVFDENKALFSAWDDAENDYVAQIKHDTRVKLDEYGVEAAAFTMISAETTAALEEEYMDFVLDRPFLFAICGNEDDILFAGVVNTVGASQTGTLQN